MSKRQRECVYNVNTSGKRSEMEPINKYSIHPEKIKSKILLIHQRSCTKI